MPIYMCTLINKGLKFKFTVSILIPVLITKLKSTYKYIIMISFLNLKCQLINIHTVWMMLYMTMYITLTHTIRNYHDFLFWHLTDTNLCNSPILYIQALLVILWLIHGVLLQAVETHSQIYMSQMSQIWNKSYD